MSEKLSEVTIHLPSGKKVSEKFSQDTHIFGIAEKYQKHYSHRILGAVCDYEIKELQNKIGDSKSVSFLTIADKDGKRFFIRSVFFVLIKAARDMFSHAELHIEYSLGNGYYCYFNGLEWINADEVAELEQRMRKIVKNDMPFIHRRYPTKKALEIFKKSGMPEKAKLLEMRNSEKTSVYSLGNTIDYFYGYLAPSTGYLEDFRLEYYKKGIVLLIPDMKYPGRIPAFKESPKFFSIIEEHNKWLEILELNNCGNLNEAIEKGRGDEIVLISEALHEKKLGMIADQIYRRKKMIRVVSIAGPSASGKTTTAKRLAIQLKVNGFKPYLISIDNYFCDRDKTPVDESGMKNFETLEAIDTELFNEHISRLLDGEEIFLQKYDFNSGKSLQSQNRLRLPEDGILIIEGIHGLNPELFREINISSVYKIYVSALTQLNLDMHNRIPTTDCRILRRIVRDVQFRNHSPEETIARWDSVRQGEEQNIFPFQENADIMFNSSLVYEFSLLKHYAQPILKGIKKESPQYLEAKRLWKFLRFFKEMDDSSVPGNSIMKEFIGGSIFKY